MPTAGTESFSVLRKSSSFAQVPKRLAAQFKRKLFSASAGPENGNEYLEGATIGSGQFGTTKILTHWQTGQRFAGKFISLDQITGDVEREIQNHRLLLHPNIVRFVKVYLTDEHLVVVLELASGGELYRMLAEQGALSEKHARNYFRQLINALAHCHAKSICHRDLKLENLLVHDLPTGWGTSRKILKICDFGFSKHAVNESTAKTCKGSPDYIAPEVMNAAWKADTGSAKYDGNQADVWSCGVILYLLLACDYPFQAKSTLAKMHKIQRRLVPKVPSHLSPECQDLLVRMLCENPHHRITTAEIQLHPWFMQGPQEPEIRRKYWEIEQPQSEAEIAAILEEAHRRGCCRSSLYDSSSSLMESSPKRKACGGSSNSCNS